MTDETQPKRRLAQTPLQHRVNCVCGQWVFDETVIVVSIGKHARVEKCPRCKQRYLLMYDYTVGRVLRLHYLGMVRIPQGDRRARIDEDALRTALAGFAELNEDERELAITSARLAVSPRRGGT